MRPPPPWTLGALYAGSEIVLGFARRSKSVDRARDRNSLTILWTAIILGVAGSIIATDKLPSAAFGHRWVSWLGLAVFAAGLLLRWYSIVHLGRFFTVDVNISVGHKVIDSGPYRVVRHPSYSGALLAFVGFGLYLHNWAALLVLLVSIMGAFVWRIHVEERVLIDALGNEYRQYASRTNRLIPLVW